MADISGIPKWRGMQEQLFRERERKALSLIQRYYVEKLRQGWRVRDPGEKVLRAPPEMVAEAIKVVKEKADKAWRTFTLPGRVYRGEPYNMDEVTAFNLSALVGGAPGGLPRGSVGAGVVGGVGRRLGTTGKYVGSPEITSPAQLGVFRRRLKNLRKEGAIAKEWYEESGRGLAEFTQGTSRAAKLSDQLAVYSPQRKLKTNLEDAVKALYHLERGLPYKAGMYPAKQGIQAQKVFAGEKALGRKQAAFAQNLKYILDPGKYPVGPVTVDVWMHRAGKYTGVKEGPGPRQYDFMEREIQRLGDEFQVLPHQAQAQIWTAIKTRYEDLAMPVLKDRAQGLGLKRGTPGYNAFIEKHLQDTAWSFDSATVKAAARKAYTNFAHLLERGGLLPHKYDIDVVDAKKFIAVRNKSSRPEFLYPYTAEELSGMRLYKVRGKDAAYALKPDGDLVNVVNASGVPGLGKEIVLDAINKGASKLDCFDGFLSDKYYPQFGFKKVRADKWDDRFAPRNWDYKKYKRPDVVYMQLEGGGLNVFGPSRVTDYDRLRRKVLGPETSWDIQRTSGAFGHSGGYVGGTWGGLGPGTQGPTVGGGPVYRGRRGALDFSKILKLEKKRTAFK